MEDGRGVVLGVAPAEGVPHHGAPQQALDIALAHPFVDGGLKVPADVDVLAHLGKDDGHACILADGNGHLPGGVQVAAQIAQDGLGGAVPLLLGALLDEGLQIGGQHPVGVHAQIPHSGGDGLRGDFSHSFSPLLEWNAVKKRARRGALSLFYDFCWPRRE